ncbi:MAG: hypothetical protein AAGJ86_09410 [Pseudomonadota bacterium]
MATLHSGGVLRRYVALFCVALTACGGGGSDSPIPQADSSSDPDLDIAVLAYSPDYRVPEGFYQEPDRYPDRSVFTFHVKQSDVGSTPVVDHELCTDDFAVALDWSEQSAAARQFDTAFSASSQGEWFFEFERVANDAADSIVINRVFRCALLDRAGLDGSPFAGQVNKEPVMADDLRFLSEYFWQFSIYNNALHAVISSGPATVADGLAHDLIRAEVRVGEGNQSGCDRVELWRWRHTVDGDTGALTSEQLFQRAFDARQVNSNVSLCD